MIRRIGGDSNPHLSQVDNSVYWEFVSPWQIEIDGVMFQFLPGFRYDRSSVPGFLPSWVISRDNLGTAAPAVHDGLSRWGGVVPRMSPATTCLVIDPWRRYTRSEADAIFRDVLLQRGVSRWRAYAAWCAVRAFGWAASWKD